MRIDYKQMIEKDFKCPLCSEKFLCTQCGPTNNKIGSWLLNKLPSATIFKQFCRIHDICYNIAPIKTFTIVNIPTIGEWKVHQGVSGRVSSDVLFYELLKLEVKEMNFFKRPFYRLIAKAYFKAVRSFGKDSFIHNHNKGV